MDYIKVDKRVEESLGRPRRWIVNQIKAGKIKGKVFSERDTRIDVNELPDGFLGQKTAVEQPQETKQEVEAPKVATTTSTELQETQDNTKLAEAKIKLAEVEGTRDLPDVIRRRDEESIQREEVSKQRESAVLQKETILSQREQYVRTQETNITNQVSEAEDYVRVKTEEADKIVADANTYDTEKRTEADNYYSATIEKADNIDVSIQSKQDEIDNLNTQVIEQIQLLVKEITKWVGIADTQATRSYRIAERSSGKTEAYHIKRSNILFDLKGRLNKILKFITW